MKRGLLRAMILQGAIEKENKNWGAPMLFSPTVTKFYLDIFLFLNKV